MRSLTVLCAVLCQCLSFFTATQATAGESQSGHIQWMTNYEEAINQSRSSSKPLILFFTGSDWCSWCTKLEQEALNTSDFISATKDRFIFLKVDFPMYTSLPSQISAQNKELQKKYDVRGFPTLVLLDAQQQKIGTIGYQPGGGTAYAASLFKMVNDYMSYRQKLQSLNQHSLSGAELKTLYSKALEIDQLNDANRIVKEGMQSDQRHFFLIERYHFLADEGLIHHDEAVALRQQLLTSDPNNAQLTHYQLAVIDFQACCEETEREHYSAELIVAPLEQYIHKFGAEDKENLWRLQMIISQVFLDNNKIPEALEYAKSSYEAAPANVQPEISLAIQNISSLLPSTSPPSHPV